MKPKRPISVWIAQIILGIYAAGIFLLVLWGLYKGLAEGIPNPPLFIVTTVGILTFAALFFSGVWGMAIRRPWGRWLGVAGLTVLLIAAAITQTSRWISDGGLRFVSLRFLFAVLVVAGLGSLAYMVAAGDASDAFFSRNVTKARRPVDQGSDN